MAISSQTRKTQLGREGTKGTATAATTIWRGMATMTDDRVVTFVDESVDNYAGLGRTYIGQLGATVTFEPTPLTPEQFPHFCEMGLKTVTPSTGGGSAIYTYYLSSTSLNTIKTYTIECGDDEDMEEAAYCFAEQITISGSVNEPVMMSATVKGRQATASTFTGSLSLPSVNEALMNASKLYICASGSAAGTTQISNSFRSFNLTINSGIEGKQTADGNLYFTYDLIKKPEVTLQITAEHDSSWDSNKEKANWRNETVRIIRISCLDTAPTTRYVHLDMAGKWETFSSITEDDGQDVLTGTFRGFYSSADTLFFKATVKNALTAGLP